MPPSDTLRTGEDHRSRERNTPYYTMVRKLIIPSPSHYAAIRLNPAAMVEDLGLNDEATLAEAKRLETKTYLAYLVWVSRRQPPFFSSS